MQRTRVTGPSHFLVTANWAVVAATAARASPESPELASYVVRRRGAMKWLGLRVTLGWGCGPRIVGPTRSAPFAAQC